MPALASAPAPVPRIGLALSSEIDLPAISFVGRSLAEYTQFFALNLPALKGRDVLDVAAGPSSFVAEACARKIHAVAVDPLYNEASEELAARIAGDYDTMFAPMRAKRRLSRAGRDSSPGREDARAAAPCPFASIEAAELDQRGASQRFLADYAMHFIHNRYVAGALPRLPFFDGTFDLVLCAHLLFRYATRFDFDWHLAACRELVRVSASEVRIHPVGGLDGKPYPALARLRRELRASGIAGEVVAVDTAFFNGATSMLVLRRAAA